MKKTVFTLITLLSSSVYASYSSEFANLNVDAPSEAEAVEKAQKAIPTIKYATNKTVVRFGREKQCLFKASEYNKNNRIKINGVDLKKMYKIENDILVPYYRASIRYIFRQCKDRRD